jgi:preprotein translocase subunit SecG
MTQILITAGFFVLILISLFLVLIVLMQRANSDGGLGTAFGSGITESAFGTEAGNVMTRITKVTFIIFFVVAFALYLGIIAQHNRHTKPEDRSLFDEEAAAEAAAQKADAAPQAPETAPAAPTEAPATPAK